MRPMNKNKGFTLIELITATLIIGIMGAALMTLLPTAIDTYNTLTVESEANMLGSTLQNLLTDELRYSQNIRTENGVLYWDGYGCGTGTHLDATDTEHVVFRGEGAKKYALLSNQAYTSGITAGAVIAYSDVNKLYSVTVNVYGEDKAEPCLALSFLVKPLN